MLDCIARWDARELVVLEDRLHPGLRGGLSLIDGRWLIILNRDDPAAQARFTLAHELGHIVLGDALSSDERPHDAGRESLCDRFAVELLLPAGLVRFAWAREADVASLAEGFQVSRLTARRRLRELGLIGRSSH